MASEQRILGVVLGGASAEHTISVRSARAVMAAVDADRWRTVPFAVSRSGRWLTPEESGLTLNAIELGAPEEIPEPPARHSALIAPATVAALLQCDAVFPLIHGSTGEDGVLQGFLETLDVPYVGSGVSASAIAMDKARCKQIMREVGIPVAPWIVARCDEWRDDPMGVLRRGSELGYPQFVKPSRGGSSIGISKIDSREEAAEAYAGAFACDSEILIEEAMSAVREIECGVLGSTSQGAPVASSLGEIRTKREFYDYTAKYEDPETELIAPAAVDPIVGRRMQDLALRAWSAVGAEGMIRADFLLGADGQLWLGELNTIPGFTSASMYPRVFEVDGLPLNELIDRLVALGIERHQRRHSRPSTGREARR